MNLSPNLPPSSPPSPSLGEMVPGGRLRGISGAAGAQCANAFRAWNPNPSGDARHPGHSAFSFVEMLVATAVLGLVVIALVGGNLFGMRMLDITRPKLEAENQTRRLLTQLIDDIGGAKIVTVGEGDAAVFMPVAAGAPMQGGALLLNPTLDTNVFTLYFRDAAGQTLNRRTNGALTFDVVARAVSNNFVFTAEALNGAILTNEINAPRQRVIGVTLTFSQIEGSGTPVGPDQYFKTNEFRTRVTPRAY